MSIGWQEGAPCSPSVFLHNSPPGVLLSPKLDLVRLGWLVLVVLALLLDRGSIPPQHDWGLQSSEPGHFVVLVCVNRMLA